MRRHYSVRALYPHPAPAAQAVDADAIAGQTVNEWAQAGKMPQMAWDFRALVADGIRRACQHESGEAGADAVTFLKRLKGSLMHTRRFGGDTLAAYRSACTDVEAEIEEWLNNRASMSARGKGGGE